MMKVRSTHTCSTVHLQGLKTLDLLVCELYPIVLLGGVVVQKCRINAEHTRSLPACCASGARETQPASIFGTGRSDRKG